MSYKLRISCVTLQVDECILWLSIIFITILCTPQPTVVRWSSTLPVSSEIMLQWKGFCALIANAYYMRGMAWWEHFCLGIFNLFIYKFIFISSFYILYAEEKSISFVVCSTIRIKRSLYSIGEVIYDIICIYVLCVLCSN